MYINNYMKNTYGIIFGDEYTATQYFDVDSQKDCIDLHNSSGRHVGFIENITIPEIGNDIGMEMASDIEVELFESRIVRALFCSWTNSRNIINN